MGAWRRDSPTAGSLSSPHHSQDLGLEGTLLTDILYRNVAFLNLVDPISHDLLVNLARDLQCPKTVRPVDLDLRRGSAADRAPEHPELGAGSLILTWLALRPEAGQSPSVLGWQAAGTHVSYT